MSGWAAERAGQSGYLRPSLRSGARYVPGEPADGEWLCLNTNEAPLPPSPAAVAAIARAASDVHRYPHPLGEPLRSSIAAHHGVEVGQVLVGAGADGILISCFRAFCEPASRIAVTEPTYPVLHDIARHFSVEVVSAPAAEDHVAMPVRGAAVTFVVNPNVPTGTWVDPALLAQRLNGTSGVVVVDEVYAPFAPASVLPHVGHHPNWLVARSFSKAYGLAGLRVGYAVGSRALISALAAVQDPYPVSRTAIAGAMAALADDEHHRSVVSTVRTERARLAEALEELGWDVPPSEGNFVFARPPGGDVARWVEGLRHQRILVRTFSAVDRERVRITVGSSQDNERLMAALAELAVRSG